MQKQGPIVCVLPEKYEKDSMYKGVCNVFAQFSVQYILM